MRSYQTTAEGVSSFCPPYGFQGFNFVIRFDSKNLYLMNYPTIQIFASFVQIVFQIAQKNKKVGKHPTGVFIAIIIEW